MSEEKTSYNIYIASVMPSYQEIHWQELNHHHHDDHQTAHIRFSAYLILNPYIVYYIIYHIHFFFIIHIIGTYRLHLVKFLHYNYNDNQNYLHN